VTAKGLNEPSRTSREISILEKNSNPPEFKERIASWRSSKLIKLMAVTSSSPQSGSQHFTTEGICIP
jgi:hypothetical protein